MNHTRIGIMFLHASSSASNIENDHDFNHVRESPRRSNSMKSRSMSRSCEKPHASYTMNEICLPFGVCQ
jgi:hypothetical protein